MSTCQYPDFRSRDVNHSAAFKQSKVSSICQRLWAFLIVLTFNFLKTIQNLNFPSFFCTNTTALAQGLVEGQMTPTSNISLI